MTYNDLITDILIEAQVYSPIQVNSVRAQDTQFVANRLNMNLDSWKAERLTIYRWQRTGPFALVGGVQTYTIGAGATWNTPRPIWIDKAGLVQVVSGGIPVPEFPIRVLTDEEWARTVVKTLSSSLPTAIWYDRTFPNGTIYVWPVPQLANQIALYSPVPVDEIVIPDDLFTTVSFPPGYREFLLYQMAKKIGPAYGKEASPTTMEQAALAMARVKDSNLHLNTLSVDPALVRKGKGVYNYLNDTFEFR